MDGPSGLPGVDYSVQLDALAQMVWLFIMLLIKHLRWVRCFRKSRILIREDGMNGNSKERILGLFKKADALLQGHFRLTSGKHSEWYFEKIRLIEKPAVLNEIVDILVERIRNEKKEFDYVISPAYGAIAIGFLAALKLGKRFAFSQRVEEKMAFRPGWSGLEAGTQAIIVEDILTTGGSIQEVVDSLKQGGVGIAGIYVLVDRTAGAVFIEGAPVGSLLALKVDAYEAEACPFCKAGTPLTKPGASDKK
jgi:orotate phosphoribosyltransferase